MKTLPKTIKVNGREIAVLNTFSCGPGQEPHTYRVTGGYELALICDEWQVFGPWAGCPSPWGNRLPMDAVEV